MTYIIQKKLRYLENCGRINETKNYIQHGSISVYTHCVNVARMSVKIAKWLPIQVNMDALVIGALLHDYFLYDWHEKDDSHKWHGFHHAKKALENALEDFKLNEIERDIIACHMFPLNIRPPKYWESWLVCYADKVCSGLETVKRKKS